MCATCGCGDDAGVRVTTVGHGQHGHGPDQHEHGPDHHHAEPDSGHTVVLEQQILAKNDDVAEHNRAWLAARELTMINLMSAPGSGKTTLLERTIREADFPLAVIEGDQETLVDAHRIEATGCPVVQINTGSGCHLDAAMTARGLRALEPRPRSVIMVENVGNLVCPGLFDLGESKRVVIVSTTEGPDKPLKYPQMFRGAHLVIVTKVDLLPHLDVTLQQITASVRAVNPGADLLAVSATRGHAMGQWYKWITDHRGK